MKQDKYTAINTFIISFCSAALILALLLNMAYNTQNTKEFQKQELKKELNTLKRYQNCLPALKKQAKENAIINTYKTEEFLNYNNKKHALLDKITSESTPLDSIEILLNKLYNLNDNFLKRQRSLNDSLYIYDENLVQIREKIKQSKQKINHIATKLRQK